MEGVSERARAKLNLGLAVRGRRADGYHELHTLFATVDVCDEVRLVPRAEGVRLRVAGEVAVPGGRENLAWRAAAAYLEAAGARGGVEIELTKRVPAGAGLGGGSADAAAVLRGLARMYPAGVDLAALARGLGADVPFLLRGGLAEARGVGEELRFLEPVEAHFVLVKPPLEAATAAAYAGLEPGDFGPELDVPGILETLRRGAPPPWRNDLERSVFRAHPELAELKRALEASGLAGVLMSGSGSTLFAPVESREKAERYADVLTQRYPGFWVRAASLVGGEGG